MTIKERIQERFNLPEENFDGHESDLYVLPQNPAQLCDITQFLRENGHNFIVSYSDVEGQNWYGKPFIDVPFMRYV